MTGCLRGDRSPPRASPGGGSRGDDRGSGRGGGDGGGDGERGSATVWTVALAGLLALLGAASVLVGAAVVARHRAGAAADLAALAVAVRAVRGDPGACATGTAIAVANGAELVGCTVAPGSVVAVEVSVPVQLGPLGLLAATGRARAGPVPWGAAP
nr:Rv3654c family TadE-like protein [Klenkia marina]